MNVSAFSCIICIKCIMLFIMDFKIAEINVVDTMDKWWVELGFWIVISPCRKITWHTSFQTILLKQLQDTSNPSFSTSYRIQATHPFQPVTGYKKLILFKKFQNTGNPSFSTSYRIQATDPSQLVTGYKQPNFFN